MTHKSNAKEETLTGWTFIWWLFKLFGFPITFPWLVFHFVDIIYQKRRRAALHSKVVMITGASSGLGEALAHTFYRCGCKLILASRRKQELERVKDTLIKTYHTVPTYPPIVLPLDLNDVNSLRRIVSSAVMIHGKIDILINNAGVAHRGGVIDTDTDVDIQVMMTNYLSQITITKIILPFMVKQQSGHIVCISSVQGKIAIPYRSAYTASKHALQAWCDTARAELHDKNIKFTVVSPGYIKTRLSLNALTANGQLYGLMDETTEKGYDSEYVAECILKSVLKQKKEVIIAPFVVKCVILLRTLFPPLYFWIMHKRAKKFKIDKQS